MNSKHASVAIQSMNLLEQNNVQLTWVIQAKIRGLLPGLGFVSLGTAKLSKIMIFQKLPNF